MAQAGTVIIPFPFASATDPAGAIELFFVFRRLSARFDIFIILAPAGKRPFASVDTGA
jgi:hypothetical protein